MTDDLDLMRLHVEAEFIHDAAGKLVSTNEPRRARAPRFFLGHTPEGALRRYRYDVSETIQREMEAALEADDLGDPTADVPLDPTPYERILSRDAPVEHTSVGLAFSFQREFLPAPDTQLLSSADDAAVLAPLLPDWIPDIQFSQPLVALVRDGRAVAICGSVRITLRAHEAGVETAIPFRGRGFAAAVVAAWASAVRGVGAEPVYSTSWQNTASRAVARKLGLVAFGRDLHIT